MRAKTQRLVDRIRVLEQNDINEGLIKHAALRFKEFEERRVEDARVIAQLITCVERNGFGGVQQELIDRAKSRLVDLVTDQEPAVPPYKALVTENGQDEERHTVKTVQIDDELFGGA